MSEFKALMRRMAASQTTPSEIDRFSSPKARSDLDLIFRMATQPPVSEPKPDDLLGRSLFKAISGAEMHGIDPEERWIRTRHKPEGDISTAWGPVQITTSLMASSLKNKPERYTKEEKKFMKRFIDQGEKFKAYDQGFIDDPRFSYGGSGELTSEEDRQLYKSVATKLLKDHYQRNKGDFLKTLREWRFGRGQMHKKKDPVYEKRALDVWKALQSN